MSLLTFSAQPWYFAPQQNAGGPAVWRNERVLPEKRGGIFRFLLRLLSAGSLCTEFRHFFIEKDALG